MDRLPLWSTVACVGLLVFVAPAALANNNNNTKPAPRPAAAPARPAPNVGQRNPMAGGNRAVPGGNIPGRNPMAGGNVPGRNPMAGGNRPGFGAPGTAQAGGGRPPYGAPGGAPGGAHPYGAPGGNVAGGPHGGPNVAGPAGGPHPGSTMAGPAGGPHGGPGGGTPYHAAGAPGGAPHPGALGPAGGPGHAPGVTPAAHSFGPAGRPGGFAGHPNFAPAPHVSTVAGARTMSHHDFVEHRADVARRFGPGHDVARDREFVHMHEHDFHTTDVASFTVDERTEWDAGMWHDDWHYGRWGWWYQVGDVWYPYDNPVYPYPLIVSAIVVPDTVVVDTRPELVAAVGGDAVAVATPLAVATVAPTGEEMVVRPLPVAPVVTYSCTTYSNVYPEIRLCPITWAVMAQ